MLSHLPVSETWENFIKVRFFLERWLDLPAKVWTEREEEKLTCLSCFPTGWICQQEEST